MKCLLKYDWVKLERSLLPQGKGVMGSWAKLAARAAFRKGNCEYCGHINPVNAGEWSGGIVGVKSILGIKSRSDSFKILDTLSELGYITYTFDEETKKLTYSICDWVIECSGKECMDDNVYTSQGYGFLCLPRNITERLINNNYIMEEADAWLDLWCHTVFEDPYNAFSFLSPAVQYGKNGAILTLETLAKRWRWEKTKVWRFFKKYRDVFTLYRLPGSYGCIIYNKCYPTNKEVSEPTSEKISDILTEIRRIGVNANKLGKDHEHINKLVSWYSRKLAEKSVENLCENRVAHFTPIIRAYISPCKNCKNCKQCKDCRNIYTNYITTKEYNCIRGPCPQFF